MLPTCSEKCPRTHVRESDPYEKRRGFLVLPSASCSATPQRSQPKPPQRDMFAPGHASLLSFCEPRALHVTSIPSRTARACLGTVSAPFLWCFRHARNYAPGQAYWSEDGIISGNSSPNCCFAGGPRTTTANLRQEPCRSSRGITGLRELVQVGLF